MKFSLKTLLAGATALLMSVSVYANDVRGEIESVDTSAQSFVVQGITFFVSKHTDYDDGLKTFADLKVGQHVEVDFEYKDKRHHALEIELDRK